MEHKNAMLKILCVEMKLGLETRLVLERAQCHGELLHLCRLGGKGDEGSGNIQEHLPSVVCLKP